MDFKQFYYDLFFDTNKSVTRMYSAKQGDTKARGFYVTILQDSVVVPVTTQTMTFYAEKPDKTRTFVEAVKDGDRFRVDLTNQVFAVPGKVKCELTLRGQSGEQVSSKTFALLVDASIQDDSIVSEDERGILDQAFELANDLIPQLQLLDVELLDQAVDFATNTLPRFEAIDIDALENLEAEVSAQLAQTEDRMNGLAIDVLYPPVPFNRAVPDANYYDEVNFKYYKDEAMTIPATDNKPMFQALVDYLFQNGGGTILVPPGEYAFRSMIRWESKVSLVGASKVATKLYAEGDIFSLIDGTHTGRAGNGSSADDPNVWFEDCTFSDFLIDNKGLSYKEPSVGGKGLFILYMKRAHFKNLVLLNTIGTALGCDFLVDTVIENIFVSKAGRNSIDTGGYGGNSGIGIGTAALPSEPLVVSNCFTYNCGNYGVFVETQLGTRPASLYAKIVNCHSYGNKYGFGNKGSGATQFIGCTAVANKNAGIHLSQESKGDLIANCIIKNNLMDGITLTADYAGELTVIGCVIEGNIQRGLHMQNSNTGMRLTRRKSTSEPSPV